MIHRREFEDKLTKELLKIVHYNLEISIRLHLFSKDVKEEQSFNSSGSLFHERTALNINERCPYDCLILGNFKFLLLFLVSLTLLQGGFLDSTKMSRFVERCERGRLLCTPLGLAQRPP